MWNILIVSTLNLNQLFLEEPLGLKKKLKRLHEFKMRFYAFKNNSHGSHDLIRIK